MVIGPPQLTQISVLGPILTPCDGVVCWPTLVSGVFPPTSGILFCSLHTRSFLRIEILRWCKHSTMPIGPPNLRNFPFWALYQLPKSQGSFRPVQVSEVSAPTGGIHFWALHARSFTLIQRLPLCKHNTMAIGPHQFMQLSVLGPIPLPMRGEVCRPSQVSGFFALSSGIDFWALHTRSFLLL